jgi:hypothetical protein
MTEQHPFNPPTELVRQWIRECDNPEKPRWQEYEQDIATRAAQWGADVELEKCCEWLKLEGHEHEHEELREARRPKPPSLKELALEQLNGIATCFLVTHGGDLVCDKIRAALEALPND